MNRHEETLNHWRSLVEERKQNNLTVNEFCKLKNISQSNYYHYQALLENPEKQKPLTKTAKKEKIAEGFKPIIMTSSTSTINGNDLRFILPNNVQLVLPRGMADSEIKAIIEILISC